MATLSTLESSTLDETLKCASKWFILIKVFWSSQNGSFVFAQIFVYGTLMGIDYKSEKKI